MKCEEILARMTIEEKAALLSGASEWKSRELKHLGIKSIVFSDGPHGLRKQEGTGDHLGINESQQATCFPTAATVANSWDEQLGEEVGRALGKEARAQGVDVLLGPGLNIKRSPLCGRNFEYFSEDPYLSGKMAAAYVRGIQSQGVDACIKHFAVNSQELRRMSVNAVLDERTLREIYLTGFEIAVKEGNVRAIMTSYNKVNGIYANENPHLLLDILRAEWGFDGLVVTDWGGSNDHVAAVKCRSDLEMPTSGFDSARELLSAIENGSLQEMELNICVKDVLNTVLRAEENGSLGKGGYDRAEHHQLAAKAARESIVLLKNESELEPLLPLKAGCRVAIVGSFAKEPRYQGSGSSLVRATKVETMEEMIGQYPVRYIGYAQGYQRNGGTDFALQKEALELAKKAEVVLYCFGLDEMSEAEGLDREHMAIPQNQVELLRKLVRVNTNIVGIMSAGSAVEMEWLPCLKALLHGYLGGQAGAGAMLDLLVGRHNPSGRLAETYPEVYQSTPAYCYYDCDSRNSEYREGVYVGYRYYETVHEKVRFPFGFGLSYTKFRYSDLKVAKTGAEVTIENIGDRDGSEVVQLYVTGPGGAIYRPQKELKGFCKVFIPADERRTVFIPFDEVTFRYWNVKTNRWETEEGIYHICIGASVEDIRLQESLWIEGTTSTLPYEKGELPSYETGMIKEVDDKEYERLLGGALEEENGFVSLGRNDAICQMHYAKSRLARMVYKCITKMKKKKEEQGKVELNILFIYNMPFRAIAKMTRGMVSIKMVDGIVDMVNGNLGRGFREFTIGFFRNRHANKLYEKKLKQIAARFGEQSG